MNTSDIPVRPDYAIRLIVKRRTVRFVNLTELLGRQQLQCLLDVGLAVLIGFGQINKCVFMQIFNKVALKVESLDSSR